MLLAIFKSLKGISQFQTSGNWNHQVGGTQPPDFGGIKISPSELHLFRSTDTDNKTDQAHRLLLVITRSEPGLLNSELK
jgi:hypothetical protein